MNLAVLLVRRHGCPMIAATLLGAIAWFSPTAEAVGAPPELGGEKTTWHGFDRYDFLLDEGELSIKPYRATPEDGTAVRTQVPGQLRCVLVAPNEPAPGRPWSWRGYYFDHEPQAEMELLKRGFHVGFILCDAGMPASLGTSGTPSSPRSTGYRKSPPSSA